MTSANDNTIILNLQQVLLDVDDNSILLNQLLPKVLWEFSTNGLDYECLGVIELDINTRITRSFFTYKTGNTINPVIINNIDFPNLFTPGNVYGAKLLQNQPVIISDIKMCTFPGIYNNLNIQSILILPIQIAQKISGFMLIGTPRVSSEISIGEVENLHMVKNIVSSGFRMQDTQVSLTKITQEVYKMNAQLHQLDRLKDDFVSIASHELRTPMTAIRSYVWMALNRSDIPLSDKLKKYLERTLISTERLINLVNDMLNISRIESGRIEIKLQPFDINTLITDIIYEVEAKAKEKGITVNAPPISPIPEVYADADKVHQVLLNLIGNALKFTPQAGHIDITFFTDGYFVEVNIKDSGVGISKDDTYKLFTKFGRLDTSYVAAATSGGTGLGLYICKSLIELMGGKIKASSEGLGKGTTFTFSLPVATSALVENANKINYKTIEEAKASEHVAI